MVGCFAKFQLKDGTFMAVVEEAWLGNDGKMYLGDMGDSGRVVEGIDGDRAALKRAVIKLLFRQFTKTVGRIELPDEAFQWEEAARETDAPAVTPVTVPPVFPAAATRKQVVEPPQDKAPFRTAGEFDAAIAEESVSL